MLILGLLIAVGLVALVGAFMISRGGDDEQPATAADKVQQAPTQPAAATPAKEQTPAVEAREAAAKAEESQAPAQSAAVVAQPIEQPAEQARLEAEKEESPYVAVSGQLHELAAQLSGLNKQSRELEHRLSRLIDLVDTIDEPDYTDDDDDDEVTEVDLPAIRNGRFSSKLDELTAKSR